jgi:cytochrome c oxidase subunit II
VRRRPIALMVLFGVVLTAIGIVLGLLIHWFPAEGSVQAGRVHTLYYVLIFATVPIFVLVVTVILFSVGRFRMRPGDELKDGPPIHGNTRLEVVWTAFPAILILGMCTYAYVVLRKNEDSKPGAMTVNVTARQFAFEFSYPSTNGKTVVSPVLYLPKGRPVVFKLRSYDVIHSFFVPDFSEKLDAVPGIVTTLRVTPTRLGDYPAECTELCGAGHGLMRAGVRVVTPQAFQTWLGQQSGNTAPPVGATPPSAAGIYPSVGGGASSSSSSSSSGASTSSPSSSSSSASSSSSSSSTAGSSGASAAAGKAVFTGSAGCGGCHTLAAAGTTGTVGPDLTTRLASDCSLPASKKARGATLTQCITTAIEHPSAYIPSGFRAGIMPPNFAQTLSPTQIQSLVTFLASVTK